MIPALYISGPFSAPDPIHGIEANIVAASTVALDAARQGWLPLCPHKLMKDFQHAEIPWERWMELCITMLGLSDAILMLDGWQNSRGATLELQWALDHGMHVYVLAASGVPMATEDPFA